MVAMAQPGPFVTLQNSNLSFAASSLTTNGIPGLTNFAPRLMVSSVPTTSAHGGSVSLINAQAWVRRHDGTAGEADSAIKVVVDPTGNIIVTGYSLGPGTEYDYATVKYAADGTGLWTNRYDGPLHKNDFVRYLATDGAGNVYVSGDSHDTGERKDVATVKYSSAGTPVWTNRFNSFGTNYIQSVGLAVDSAGNAYILPQDFNDLNPGLITVKYDPSGVAAWTNHYKGSSNGSDYPLAIAVDGAGNVFITGSSYGIFTGYNYVTVKYAPDGAGLWTNRYVRSGNEQPAALALDHAGDVIVTGDGFDLGHIYATVKYANDGTPLWTNLLTGPSYQGGYVPTVVADVSGNVFVTGGSPAANGENADFTTVKLTAGGIPLWTNRFFETNIGNPYLAGTAVDSAGNFYLAGHSRNATGVNFLTAKFNDAGVALWTNHYNGPSGTDDIANSIAASADGQVYVTGLSSGWASGLDFATVKYTDYIRYTPPPDFTGTDTFAFTVVDYRGNAATGVVTVAVLPRSLRFNIAPPNFQFAASGLTLRVDGALGPNPVILLASTNLLDWQPIATNLPVLGSANFLDPGVTNQSKRFYRARQ